MVPNIQLKSIAEKLAKMEHDVAVLASGPSTRQVKEEFINRLIVYTYYSAPWILKSGDDVRIHSICKALRKLGTIVVVFNLSHLIDRYMTARSNGVLYICIPRKFYRLISKILRWKRTEDLNPLIKLTHYVDEFIAVVKLLDELRESNVIYVFGSMTLFSLFARILGIKAKIIYDPLANYAQTLYLWSRGNIRELFRYGLYLVLHKLQLRSSNYIVYPSQHDLRNAECMFRVRNTSVIPNPLPVCYESFEEYLSLRSQRKEFDKPYFVLLAGTRGKGNEEAVKLTIGVFNELPPDRFRLFITGPWQDMKRYVKNPSIKILGVVSHEKLKELLAMSDYGLVPIFSHVAGTFLKTLAYIAASLDIITTPHSLQGVDLRDIARRNIKIYLVRNYNEYRDTVYKLVLHRI